MPKPETLGDRLRKLRNAKALTHQDVAVAVGISRSAYSGIESGQDNPGRETLIAIADFFSASLDWIEGRLDKVNMPELGQFVEDRDELAMLNFWRALDRDGKLAVVRLLGYSPPAPARTQKSG